MNKTGGSPFATPFEHRVMPSVPDKMASDCNYLEHTDVEDLKMRSDTSVLKEAFFAKGDSLNWHFEALASPMGTDIPNPKNLKR